MIAFNVQLTDKRVRVVLNPRGINRTLYAYFSYKGSRHNVSTGFSTERDARSRARSIVETIAARSDVGFVQTFASVVDDYLNVRWPNAAPGTKSHLDARQRILRFVEWCTDADILDWHVRPFQEASSIFQRFIDFRRQKCKPLTLRNDRLVVSALCSYMIRRSMNTWPANPLQSNRIEIPRVTRTIAAPVSKTAIESFLRGISAHPLHSVCVLILSGLRPNAALCDIHWADIDFDHQRIITTEKGKSRQLPLTEWATVELKRFADKATKTDRVWTNSRRKGFMYCNVLASALGTPEITLQSLRRAFIFRLWQLGVSPQLASKLAGNTVETAMRHYADSDLLSSGNVLEQLDWMQTSIKSAPNDDEKHS